MVGLFLLLPVLSVERVSAQEANTKKFTTQATDEQARPDAKKQGPKEKKTLYIIRENTRGTLYGNECVEEVNEKYGFKYLVVPEKIPPNRNAFRRNTHNFGVNFVLFFRNGPLWKSRMKKKYKDCKYGYGDFVG